MLNITFMRRIIYIAAIFSILGVTDCSNVRNENYLQTANEASKPNTNFLYATNASLPGRVWMTLFGRRYKTCINTVTSFYNKRHTCSNCEDFERNPEKWSFRKTDHPRAGDIIIQHDPKTGRAFHAVIIVGIEDGKYYVNHAVRNRYFKNVELKNTEKLTFYEYIR